MHLTDQIFQWDEDIRAQAPKTQGRAEMRGPQSVDLDNLLSGLKTRDVEPSQGRNDENESMISASSIQDNQNNVLPKKTRRKQRSDKNVVAIDI